MSDLNFNGTELVWTPSGESVTHTFRATSGLVDGKGDFRRSDYQCRANSGPIPQGRYVLSLEVSKAAARDDGKGECNLAWSSKIQAIPRGKAAGECEEYWANWGYNRAALQPFDKETKEVCKPRRGGFYIHDSAKGYTHGCIEVEKTFFTILRKYASYAKERKLILRVTYPGKAVSTYGATDR